MKMVGSAREKYAKKILQENVSVTQKNYKIKFRHHEGGLFLGGEGLIPSLRTNLNVICGRHINEISCFFYS